MIKEKKIVRLTTNNQVAVPAFIVRDLKLHRGSYLEVEEIRSRIVMTPKRFVDEEDFARYEAVIKKGREEIKRGQTVSWEEVKRKLEKKGLKKAV